VPLPFAQKLGYGCGRTLDTIVQQTLSVFLLFYVTSVCGIPGGLAGAAIAAGLVVDAFLDPLIGTASDDWRSRWGRRLPFMAYSEKPVATKLEDADDLLNFAAGRRFLVPGEVVFSANARPSNLPTSPDRILGRSTQRAIR
jgi:hypothetical protein